jgi:ABC-2 type transport system permease protein
MYLRQPSSWMVVGAAALLLLAAGIIGHRRVLTQIRAQQAAQADEAQRLKETQNRIQQEIQKLQKANQPLDPVTFGFRHATSIGHYQAKRYAILPPSKLAAISAGDTDIETSQILVSVDPKQFRGQNEVQQPLWLRAGRFDAGFLISYVLPLLLLAAIGPAITSDRGGTLQLTAAQGFPVWKIALVRVMVRGLPVIAAVSAGLWLVAMPTPAEVPTLLWLSLAAMAYGLFWMGVAAFIDATSPSSGAAVIRMAAVWMFFAFAAPGLVNALAVNLFPVESRAELGIALREAQQEVWDNPGGRIMKDFYAQYPDIKPESLGSLERFMISQMRMVLEEERRVSALNARYDQQRTRQAAVSRTLRFVSPALMMQYAMEETAGTGPGRRGEFRRQFDRYFHQWQDFFVPKIYYRTPISDVYKTPAFHFQEEPWYTPLARTVPDLAILLIVTAAMTLVAVRGYRRMPVV